MSLRLKNRDGAWSLQTIAGALRAETKPYFEVPLTS
jgi:hypothetical protein